LTDKSNEYRIVRKQYISDADYTQISALQRVCEDAEGIALKLELDYKLADAQNRKELINDPTVNEFMCYHEDTLIAYLGICGFGEQTDPLELTGMVHPDYRRMGIFRTLSEQALAECRRRNTRLALGLCDRKSEAGQAMLHKRSDALHHTEYEMVLQGKPEAPGEDQLRGVNLRKAVNADAAELARQDSIYFGEEFGQGTEAASKAYVKMPEEEEKRGFIIYLAVKNGAVIGKVNLQISNGLGGIYGLGVLPEERGKGYGRAILRLAVQKLIEAGAETVYLQVLTDNEKALALYRSCGFETRSVMDYFIIG